MSAMYIVLSLLLFVACIAINVMILMQKKRSAGLSAGMTGMGQGDTYWDKNKGRSLEGQLEKYTKVCAVIFMFVSLVLNVIR